MAGAVFLPGGGGVSSEAGLNDGIQTFEEKQQVSHF